MSKHSFHIELLVLLLIVFSSCNLIKRDESYAPFDDHFECGKFRLPSETLKNGSLLPDPERDFLKEHDIELGKSSNKNVLCSDKNPNPTLTTIRAEENIHVNKGKLYLPIRRNPWPGCSECGFISKGYIRTTLKDGMLADPRPVARSYEGLKALDIAGDGTILAISTASKQLLNAILYLKSGSFEPFKVIVPYAKIYPYKIYFLKRIFSLPDGSIALCVLDRDTEYWEIHIFDPDLKKIENIKAKPSNPNSGSYQTLNTTIEKMLKHNRTYPANAFYPRRIKILTKNTPPSPEMIRNEKSKWYSDFLKTNNYTYFPEMNGLFRINPVLLPEIRRKGWEKAASSYDQLNSIKKLIIKKIEALGSDKGDAEKLNSLKKDLKLIDRDIFWSRVNATNPGVLFTYDQSGRIFVQPAISHTAVAYDFKKKGVHYIADPLDEISKCFLAGQDCNKEAAYKSIMSRLSDMINDREGLKWDKFLKKWKIFLSISANKNGLFARQRFLSENDFLIDVFDDSFKPVARNVHTSAKLLNNPGANDDSFWFLKEINNKDKNAFEQPDYELLQCRLKQNE